MLVVGHEIFPDDRTLRIDQVLDRMWNTVGAQSGSDVVIEKPELANDCAIGIGEQGEPDRVLVRKISEGLHRVIADGRDTQTLLFEQWTRLFQLDQLGAAVLSPIGTAVKYEKKAPRPGEIGQRPYDARLIRERKRGNALARFGTGSVMIVGSLDVFGAQFVWNRLSGGSEPSELTHDGGFFSQIFR